MRKGKKKEREKGKKLNMACKKQNKYLKDVNM